MPDASAIQARSRALVPAGAIGNRAHVGRPATAKAGVGPGNAWGRWTKRAMGPMAVRKPRQTKGLGDVGRHIRRFRPARWAISLGSELPRLTSSIKRRITVMATTCWSHDTALNARTFLLNGAWAQSRRPARATGHHNSLNCLAFTVIKAPSAMVWNALQDEVAGVPEADDVAIHARLSTASRRPAHSPALSALYREHFARGRSGPVPILLAWPPFKPC